MTWIDKDELHERLNALRELYLAQGADVMDDAICDVLDILEGNVSPHMKLTKAWESDSATEGNDGVED